MIIKIIGLGGIGSILSENLCRYLNYSKNNLSEVCLIDGDYYEDKNFERQIFTNLGNKSQIKCDELKEKFNRIDFSSFPHYINTRNVDIIKDNDIIFICVDNHKTRNIINERALQLDNITIISGGNEYTDGNVQIFIKENGFNKTPSLTDYHPEIKNSNDRSPEDMSCEELSKTEPQLFFTNLMAATLMCCAFYNITFKGTLVSETYFDIKTMNTLSKIRKLK